MGGAGSGSPATTASGSGSPADFLVGKFDDGKGHTLPYRLYVPRGYDPTRSYPLVLFLHGSGGRGVDNVRQLTDQTAALVFVKPENQARWPAFMLAPQCPPDQQWVDMPWGNPSGKGKQPAKPTWPLAAAIALVDKVRADHVAIDPKQLIITGMSMGGYGTWDAAVRNPTKWKAAVIVCGGYDETTIAPIVTLPIWVFHAADDPTVPVSRSRDMVAALRARGGNPRYTEYPASDHHGHFSWRPAYSDPALLPWLFGSQRGGGGTPAPPSPR